jgi:hypothetical protein
MVLLVDYLKDIILIKRLRDLNKNNGSGIAQLG